MVKSEIRTIDGMSVATTQLPAEAALELFARVGKLIGPALMQLVVTVAGAKGEDDGAEDDLLNTRDVVALAPVAAAFFGAIAPGDLTRLKNDLLAATLIDGGPAVGPGSGFDLKFQGRILTLFRVMVFVLRVNYSDFFSAGAAAVKKQGKAGATPPTSSEPSPG